MDTSATITLDGNLLTAAGIAVAILAALYSARSARAAQRQAQAAEASLNQAAAQLDLARSTLTEAKRQSRIAGHGHRLEAFKALLAFRGQVTAKGIDFKREAIWDLWEHADIAEFYFSELLAKRMRFIVDAALKLQASRDEWKEDSSFPPSQREARVKATHDQLPPLRDEVEAVEQLMRKELRLADNAD